MSSTSTCETQISSDHVPSKKEQLKQFIDPLWEVISDAYTVQEPIGQGAFGQVVKAVHNESQQVVAIKLMKNLFASDY